MKAAASHERMTKTVVTRKQMKIKTSRKKIISHKLMKKMRINLDNSKKEKRLAIVFNKLIKIIFRK
jgi:hypothetical protein